MAQEITTVTKTTKDIERQLTVAENRLAFVQQEEIRAKKNIEDLGTQIASKKSEYDLYIASKDADSKKMRHDILQEREQMEKDKMEFQGILQKFKFEQNGLVSAKEEFENDKRKTGAQLDNIRQFIIAVQRASSLLGL